jgi:ABC-type transport system involved in multi-copper enzyme maturation permease subunit
MIRRVTAIATSVLADAVRRKIVYVVVLFAAIMAVAIPSLPSYGVGVVEGVYREVALTLTYVAVMAVTLVLSANRVPSEIETRIVYNILARDVRRAEYLIGTWLGIMLTIGCVLLAFLVIDIGVGWITYGEPMLQLWQGVFSIWLEAGTVAAFCVAVSAAAGPVIVAVSAFVFLFAGHVRSALLAADTLAYRLYPSLDSFNIINPVSHGVGVGPVYLVSMILIFAGWVAALLLVGVVLLNRRDL